MKKNLFILSLISLLFASCSYTYVTFEDLTPKDYGKFIRSNTFTSSYSPTEYNVIKGYNPANEYNWQEVYITKWTEKPFKYYYYKGDDALLLRAYYADAECILSYSGSYFVGNLKE